MVNKTIAEVPILFNPTIVERIRQPHNRITFRVDRTQQVQVIGLILGVK